MLTVMALVAGFGLGFMLVAVKARRPREYGAVLLLAWIVLRLLLVILTRNPVLMLLNYFILGQLVGTIAARRLGFAE